MMMDDLIPYMSIHNPQYALSVHISILLTYFHSYGVHVEVNAYQNPEHEGNNSNWE